ncbi:homeobox-leucine zipper protein ATHB-40-like [Chenopodium quinoa]|uniref:Homeobox-leucine zipper protein n=1 Tax=Chenopodium quinoa TaxID=63459 RepID=A0A803KXF3_CHEQI|nr:homeobox-leucine zipper protein ATHB-40-like [Chenopodium quinoa]
MQGEDNPVGLIPQLYSGIYNQMAPQQGDPPKRRRRRKNKGDGSSLAAKKRKLSEEQVNMLEMSFGCEHKLESERKDRLASELNLDPRQVAVWFQNRRARWKNKKLEHEYSKLKNEHEKTIVEKCRLETEVLSLKEQLSNAQKEMQKLVDRSSTSSSAISSNSPSSSLTMDQHPNVVDPQLLEEQIGIGGCFDSMFYVPDTNYGASMDWAAGLYM